MIGEKPVDEVARIFLRAETRSGKERIEALLKDDSQLEEAEFGKRPFSNAEQRVLTLLKETPFAINFAERSPLPVATGNNAELRVEDQTLSFALITVAPEQRELLTLDLPERGISVVYEVTDQRNPKFLTSEEAEQIVKGRYGQPPLEVMKSAYKQTNDSELRVDNGRIVSLFPRPSAAVPPVLPSSFSVDPVASFVSGVSSERERELEALANRAADEYFERRIAEIPNELREDPFEKNSFPGLSDRFREFYQNLPTNPEIAPSAERSNDETQPPSKNPLEFIVGDFNEPLFLFNFNEEKEE